jgi:hypothetical protein
MTKDPDMDLYRRFDDIREPGRDELFVKDVTRRVARHRRGRWVMLILISIAAVVFLALYTPRLIHMTAHIAVVSKLLVNGVLMAVFSPFGLIIGAGVGLSIFLRTRA